MSLQQRVLVYTLIVVGVVVLFAVSIGFRHDTALMTALTAAGTVAAAGFAALAAVGSMRAAAESSTTARRSREALARTVRPRIQPSLHGVDGRLFGTLQCGEGRAALDVLAVWSLTNRPTVVGQAAHLDPPRPDTPAAPLTVDLGLPDTADPAAEVQMLWVEYWDDGRVGHWRDTWQVGAEPSQPGTLRQTDSDLVD